MNEHDPTGRAAHDPGSKLDAGKPRLLCWSWQLRDPCGLQCRAHHQGEHRQPVQQD